MIPHAQGRHADTPPRPTAIAASLPADSGGFASLHGPAPMTRRFSGENLRGIERLDTAEDMFRLRSSGNSNDALQYIRRQATNYARQRFDVEKCLAGPHGPHFWPTPMTSRSQERISASQQRAWQAYEDGFELDRCLAAQPRLRLSEGPLENSFSALSLQGSSLTSPKDIICLDRFVLEHLADTFWKEMSFGSPADKDAKLNHFIAYVINGDDGWQLSASKSALEGLLSFCGRKRASLSIHYTLLRLGDGFNTPLMRLQYLQLTDSWLTQRLKLRHLAKEQGRAQRTLFLGELASGKICWFTSSHQLKVDSSEHHVRGFLFDSSAVPKSETFSRSPLMVGHPLVTASPLPRVTEPRVFPRVVREPPRRTVGEELYVGRPSYVRLNLARRQIEEFDCQVNGERNPAMALLIATSIGHFLLTDPLTFAESGQGIFGQEEHWFRGPNEVAEVVRRIDAVDYERYTRPLRSSWVKNLVEG